MAKNMKTPAMVLQEYTVKEGIPPPEYNLIRSKTGTHENEFHYQVDVGGIIAVGFGRSKQVAKHDTAQKALQILADRGRFVLDNDSIQEFNPQLHRNETDSRSIAPLNYVGTLKDLCAEHKINKPIFTEMSDVGPPHARQFTWKCQVSSIATQCTANTKKQAKQLCAKDMLERLKDVLPDIVKEEEIRRKAITEDATVIAKYLEVSSYPGVVLNKGINIADYDSPIRTIMEERNLTYEDFAEHFTERSKEKLQDLLEKLGLEYRFDHIQGTALNHITILSISLDVPCACAGMGTSQELAIEEVLDQTFDTLLYYMSISDEDK